jgi:thioredoxin 1
VGYDEFNNRGGMMGNTIKVDAASWEKEILKAPGLVLVDFWAVWCGPCRMVAPVVEELADEYTGRLKVAKLNTDENPDVASQYHIMGIPTLLFFKDGKPVDKIVGAAPKKQFKDKIESLLSVTGQK